MMGGVAKLFRGGFGGCRRENLPISDIPSRGENLFQRLFRACAFEVAGMEGDLHQGRAQHGCEPGPAPEQFGFAGGRSQVPGEGRDESGSSGAQVMQAQAGFPEGDPGLA